MGNASEPKALIDAQLAQRREDLGALRRRQHIEQVKLIETIKQPQRRRVGITIVHRKTRAQNLFRIVGKTPNRHRPCGQRARG